MFFRKILILLALAGLWLGAADAGAAVEPDDDAPTTTAKAADATTSPTGEDDFVAELVRKTQLRVAHLRSLPMEKPVDFKPMDREQLRKAVESALAEQLPPELMPLYEFVWRRLGLMTGPRSLKDVIAGLFTEQVAGLYDEKSQNLYVMTSFDLRSTMAEVILAHEICHALQDQNYDLSEWPLRESHNDDRAYAALSVLEGDATLLMTEYATYHVQPGRWLAELPNLMLMMGGGQPNLERAPYFLQQQLLFPYLEGVNFMDDAIAMGKRDAALRDYPRSTEQILHPEKYFATPPDEPTSVSLAAVDKALPKGWARRYYNTMGEAGTLFLLQANYANHTAEAAAGWDGDCYALYGPATGPVTAEAYAIVWKSVWDTKEDAAEFALALQRAARVSLFETRPKRQADGAIGFEKNGRAALIQRLDRQVIFVDASSAERTRRLMDVALGY